MSVKKLLILSLFVFNFHTLYSQDNSEKKSIEDAIDRYFQTWSNEDMEGYESCFHPDAIIHYERNGEINESKLKRFIEGQKNAHLNSSEKMKEIPLSKKIQIDKTIAQVTVRWKLTADNREQYGFDYFTLVKYKKKWKIIYLIFNSD